MNPDIQICELMESRMNEVILKINQKAGGGVVKKNFTTNWMH